MDNWQVLSHEVVFENRILTLKNEKIRDGRGLETQWNVVEVGDGAAVMPRDRDGRILLIRQYRHVTEGPIWEFPAGRVDAGESAREAAVRELQEEAGFSAGRVVDLGFVWPLVGIARHKVHLFAAEDLSPVETALESFEDIEVHWFDEEELVAMMARGDITDGLTLSLWMRWQLARGTS